jgi:hypothetical protein
VTVAAVKQQTRERDALARGPQAGPAQPPGNIL